jgi:hypothetical protein
LGNFAVPLLILPAKTLPFSPLRKSLISFSFRSAKFHVYNLPGNFFHPRAPYTYPPIAAVCNGTEADFFQYLSPSLHAPSLHAPRQTIPSPLLIHIHGQIDGQIDGNIPPFHSRLIHASNPNPVLSEVPRANRCGAMSAAPPEFASACRLLPRTGKPNNEN